MAGWQAKLLKAVDCGTSPFRTDMKPDSGTLAAPVQAVPPPLT